MEAEDLRGVRREAGIAAARQGAADAGRDGEGPGLDRRQEPHEPRRRVRADPSPVEGDQAAEHEGGDPAGEGHGTGEPAAGGGGAFETRAGMQGQGRGGAEGAPINSTRAVLCAIQRSPAPIKACLKSQPVRYAA